MHLKMKTSLNLKKYACALIIIGAVLTSGCEKYLNNTKLPANTIDGSSVYSSDFTTSSVITSVFINMNSAGPFNASGGSNVGYSTALYVDELKNLGNAAYDVFYKDAIQSGQSLNWSTLYSKIYVINLAIEGINNSSATLTYKNQWLGEAYFLRAFCYYYLTSFYGDVPLALTSDYKVNNQLSRAPQAEVYQQIITDLKLAQTLLSDDYRDGYGATSTNRLRPNKAAATAFLARVYLYAKDWTNAEAQATTVINNTANYQLLPLAQVFLANSKETILALAPSSAKVANEYTYYNNGMPSPIPVGQSPATFFVYPSLSDFQLKAFETTDGRLANWVRLVTVAGTTPVVTFYFPNKYKSATTNAEYEVLFRLAEQYLIRAEARAMLNESNAAADINAIRNRAGLGNTTASIQKDLLDAIAKERQTELFTECGHRFFDLKRTGTIDAVMAIVAPTKPTVWASYMSLWPIPPNDLIQDPNLTPNPGYLQ
jgi:hypothetical protein